MNMEEKKYLELVKEQLLRDLQKLDEAERALDREKMWLVISAVIIGVVGIWAIVMFLLETFT